MYVAFILSQESATLRDWNNAISLLAQQGVLEGEGIGPAYSLIYTHTLAIITMLMWTYQFLFPIFSWCARLLWIGWRWAAWFIRWKLTVWLVGWRLTVWHVGTDHQTCQMEVARLTRQREADCLTRQREADCLTRQREADCLTCRREADCLTCQREADCLTCQRAADCLTCQGPQGHSNAWGNTSLQPFWEWPHFWGWLSSQHLCQDISLLCMGQANKASFCSPSLSF